MLRIIFLITSTYAGDSKPQTHLLVQLSSIRSQIFSHEHNELDAGSSMDFSFYFSSLSYILFTLYSLSRWKNNLRISLYVAFNHCLSKEFSLRRMLSFSKTLTQFDTFTPEAVQCNSTQFDLLATVQLLEQLRVTLLGHL